MASVHLGEIADSAIARLGPAVTVAADTVHGADNYFPVMRYTYRDFAMTVSEATGRIAELHALAGDAPTPLGVHLGMSRRDVEGRFPPGALEDWSGFLGDYPKGAVGASACGSRFASAVVLAFDSGDRLSYLVFEGYFREQ